MHSPRCVRIMNMKVLAVCGFFSVIITTYLTLRYTAVQHAPVSKDLPLQHLDQMKGPGSLEMHIQPFRPKPTLTKCENQQVLDTRPLLSVPRIAKYCNIPNSSPPGDEGMVPEDLKLMGAHVVIRHGDRAPLIHLPGDKAPPLSYLVDARQFHHLPKLQNYEHVMAQAAQIEDDVTSEFSRWAMYPSRSECGEGQLTGQGAMQQVLNGLHLHQRYAEPPHNLRLDHSTVAVHSTVVSRTYQSALAFLYGLLPQFDRKQIKIQSTPTLMFCDSKAAPGSVCLCPGLETLRNRAVASCRSEGAAAHSLATYEVITTKTLAQVFGVSSAALPSPEGVMDGLSRYACHSIPPPCITLTNSSSGSRCTTTTCIDAKTMEGVWAPVDAQSRCMSKNSNFLKYSAVSTHGLLLRIAQGLHRIMLGNISTSNDVSQNPLFVLYSGHDNTLTPLITALGLEEAVWPGYATRLVFELYKRASTPDVRAQHFVRILLNGKPVTSETVFCHSGSVLSGRDDLCEFERFYSHIVSMNVQEFCLSLRSSRAQNLRRKRGEKKTKKL